MRGGKKELHGGFSIALSMLAIMSILKSHFFQQKAKLLI